MKTENKIEKSKLAFLILSALFVVSLFFPQYVNLFIRPNVFSTGVGLLSYLCERIFYTGDRFLISLFLYPCYIRIFCLGAVFALLFVYAIKKHPNPQSSCQSAAFALLAAAAIVRSLDGFGLAVETVKWFFIFLFRGELWIEGYAVANILRMVCYLGIGVCLIAAVRSKNKRYGKNGFITIAAIGMALVVFLEFIFGYFWAFDFFGYFWAFDFSPFISGFVEQLFNMLLSLLPAAALLLLSLNNGFTSEEAYAAAKASASGGMSGAEERLMQLAARYREGKITAEEYNRERANIYREL